MYRSNITDSVAVVTVTAVIAGAAVTFLITASDATITNVTAVATASSVRFSLGLFSRQMFSVRVSEIQIGFV